MAKRLSNRNLDHKLAPTLKVKDNNKNKFIYLVSACKLLVANNKAEGLIKQEIQKELKQL